MGKVVYIKLFVDYLDAVEPLGDAERGRLFTALMKYAKTGEAPQLSGNERFVFPMMKAQIDRDIESQEEISAKRAIAGSAGGKASQAKAHNTSKSKQPKAKQANAQKTIDNNEDKEENNPPYPLSAVSDLSEFGPELEERILEWLQYKKEKGDSYKPTGLKRLLTQIKTNAQKYGEQAVCSLILECEARNYQGIIFDKLETGGNNRGLSGNTPTRDQGRSDRPHIAGKPLD